MKKIFRKIKISITTFWIALISIYSKVIGNVEDWRDPDPQPSYGITMDQQLTGSPFIAESIKITQRALIAITFIIGIVSFIRIKKTNDKIQKKKRIKNTIIVISILIILITALRIFTPSLIEFIFSFNYPL